MKFRLTNRWPQEPATPSTVFNLVGDYGYGLGKGKIAACYGAGTIKHIAGVCLLQFDRFSQVDMRRFFNQLRLDIPLFIPETDLFTEGFFNDPKVARATFPQWWPLVLRVIDNLQWNLRQRGIYPSVFFHSGSVAGHYLVGVASASEMMKRWPAPTTKHILVLPIPTEPALLGIFDEMLAAYQNVGFDVMLLTHNKEAEKNDTIIKALVAGLLKGRSFDHAYPPPANAAHRVEVFATTGLSTVSGAQVILPAQISPSWAPQWWQKSVELRDDQLVNDTCFLIHQVVEQTEAASLKVTPDNDLTTIVVIATPLPPSALDVLKKRVEERLSLERQALGCPSWKESHPGVQLLFVPNAVPIDVRGQRTAFIVGAWYPITKQPPTLAQALGQAQHLRRFRRGSVVELLPGADHNKTSTDGSNNLTGEEGSESDA